MGYNRYTGGEMVPIGVKIACIVLVCCIGFIIGLFFCPSPDHNPKVGPDNFVVGKPDRPDRETLGEWWIDRRKEWKQQDMGYSTGCVNPAHSENHEDAAKGMWLNY